MALIGKQRKHLRALAHDLNPVVMIGRRGLNDAVLAQIDTALTDHELIKIKLGAECPLDRNEIAGRIEAATGAAVAGLIGRVLIVYRPHPEEPRIQLPE